MNIQGTMPMFQTKNDFGNPLSAEIEMDDETYIDPNSQPRKFWTDITIRSAEDAKNKGLTSGLQWNAGRGNRLLILHMTSPDGLIKECERIWIHTKRKVQSDDYHNDIDSATFYNWFKDALQYLPLNAVVVIDNASIHNKREEGTPTRNTRKGDMQNWLMETPLCEGSRGG